MTKVETLERLVHVPLGERSYDILIGPGLMARAGGEITSRIKGGVPRSSPTRMSAHFTSTG